VPYIGLDLIPISRRIIYPGDLNYDAALRRDAAAGDEYAIRMLEPGNNRGYH
jgi:hypothetical protein